VSRSEQLRAAVLKKAEDNDLELDAVEEETLDRACELADTVEEIDAVLKQEGLTVPGPGNIIRKHPLVEERRQSISLLNRLVTSIKLDVTRNETPSQQARRAAKARWGSRPGPTNVQPRKLPDAV
jgi:hypothetical protein